MAEEQIDNETLINCVQHNRVVYVYKSCKDFKIPLQKRNARQEIRQKVGIDISDAKKIQQ